MDEFLRAGLVGFGDGLIGSVGDTTSKQELIDRFARHHPEQKEGSRLSWVSQLFRFLTEVKVGDDVITFDRERRRYLVGKISGNYRFEPNVPGRPAHVRAASWTAFAPRDSLAAATRNTLGSTLTIFRLGPEFSEDVLAHARALGMTDDSTRPLPPQGEQPSLDDGFSILTEDTLERANEFIEDLINALDWEDMQHLVAGLLRAMGYRTTVSEPGPDRGVDIFASPDGLGLEEPRIFVEVKHRNAQMGSKEIRSFVGGRRKGDKCLYVSTSGFSKDAYYEAERAEVALQLVTLQKLRHLVVEYYEKLDPETRALVPLRRLYWPAPREKG